MSRQAIVFLGSSVVYGSASNGYSFVDALCPILNVPIIKEAVSGTTLVDHDSSSYVARLKQLSTNLCPVALMCQLSTNDATQGLPLGDISSSRIAADFDTHTITGALEFIISYTMATWHCPVFFFTGTRYNSHRYEQMIYRLHELAQKWPIHILDLWNDVSMNAVTPSEYARWMADPIHPTREGYIEWWTPKFRDFLLSHISK